MRNKFEVGNEYCKNRMLDIKYRIDENGCHICTSHKAHSCGYIRVQRDNVYELLHRLVYMEENNVILTREDIIMHLCDNKLCINPAHLKKGTQQENMTDMVRKGRSLIGEKNHQHKLTEKQVVEIFYDKDTQMNIAHRYNINQALVSAIKLKKSWKCVVGDL